MMGYDMQHGRQEETSAMRAVRANRVQGFWGRTPTPNMEFATSNHLQPVD